MDKLTRRKFCVQSSVGVGTVGALAAALTLGTHLEADAASSYSSTTAKPDLGTGEPVMLYVRDFNKNEVGLLTGKKEVVFQDAALVARILRAAQ